MSEIFFKLRIKEMLEGKMKRYFIFGIVEILLVVAGILIALSVNNWDIKKSERKNELNIYKSIRNRINDDKHALQGNYDYNINLHTQFNFAVRIINENDRNNLDTLAQIAPNLFKYSDFNRSSNVYQNLINSGESKLLTNTSILSSLQDLEETYIYLNRMEAVHQQLILDHIGPAVLINIHLASGKVERPDDLYSFYFQNLLLTSISIMKEKDELYQRASADIDSITILIDEELKK